MGCIDPDEGSSGTLSSEVTLFAKPFIKLERLKGSKCLIIIALDKMLVFIKKKKKKYRYFSYFFMKTLFVFIGIATERLFI